jgi:predicted lipoprotein with Yx(FWY)xxD motif
MRKRTVHTVAMVGAAIAVAGCGSSSSGSSSSSATTPAPAGSTAAAQAAPKSTGVRVSVRKVSFGKVLVGPNGHTVYLFLKDKGTKSNCSGKCAHVWTPLVTTGRPQAASGLTASMLATTKRANGTTQVTYGGHPLYFYEDDKRPGTTEGEGSKEFGAEWYAVGPNGKKVEKEGS